MFKKILSLFAVIAFLAATTGCGSSTKKNEIVMWLVGSEAQARTIMELGKSFTEKTGVKVSCQAISWGNAHSKYLTSIAGDVTPDIGTMGLTWGMEFGELGALVDLNKDFKEDIMEIQKTNFPGLVESSKLGDKIFGVPFDMSIQLIYYRTDMIKNVPDTWEDLLVLLADLKSQGKGMVIDWGSLDWIGFAPFLWQAGGNFYNEDYTKVTLDTPSAAKAMDFFASLYKNGVPKTTVPLEQGIRIGDYPIAFSGNWKIISLTLGAPEIKGKWKIAMLPKGPTGKRTSFIGGRIMSVFSKSNMKKESVEFIKFLSQSDIQVKLYNASMETEDSYLPPNIDTWKSLEMDQAMKEVLEKQAWEAKGPPAVLGWDGSTRFVNYAIQMVILKDAKSADELKKANEEIQKELDKILKKGR
ncbi:family 1 extracellular solute-binding protein [Candidatus Omnitrophus magneticus]|uniref:Family 1 extracellular solute-binding protein n=1 Tax=Candidatus Omnitrophus magneticus TaxID=1609969 RepID=A0A0F0CUX7_9BACT|nr:family 1 extracellular solute-binding protein [Candidatus Omnitrophus magneticus]